MAYLKFQSWNCETWEKRDTTATERFNWRHHRYKLTNGLREWRGPMRQLDVVVLLSLSPYT